MPLPVAEVQRALADDRLDGWLLYDFQGSNPIAARLSGLTAGKKMTTRRWYYLIPATASRGAWSMLSSGTTSTACRATSSRMPGATGWKMASAAC